MITEKKRKKLDSSRAKAVIDNTKFVTRLAQHLQDAGFSTDERLKEMANDPVWTRILVRAIRRSILKPVNVPFTMIPEPPNREVQDSDEAAMRAQFKIEYWLRNQFCGHGTKRTLNPWPWEWEKVPLQRTFQILEIRRTIPQHELKTVLQAQDCGCAFLFDLIRVRNWESDKPLLAPANASSHGCPCLRSPNELAMLEAPRFSMNDVHFEKGDRVLIWKKADDNEP